MVFKDIIRPNNYQFVHKAIYLSIGLILLVIVLLVLSRINYLLFHSLVEILSIIVASLVFVLMWNRREFINNGMLLIIGISYLFVAILDTIHTLSYSGMGVFPGDSSNLAIQLWIASRTLESFSLLIAPLFMKRRVNSSLVFLVYGVVSIIFLHAIYFKYFPDCYIGGFGLTPFKKISEYVISLILLGSIGIFYYRRRLMDFSVFKLLIISIIITIFAELLFTFYVSLFGLFNIAGHILKLISFGFIYQSIVVVGLKKPQDLIFLELKRAEADARANEMRYRSLFENAIDAIYLIDPVTYRIAECNLKASEMTGYSMDELKNISMSNLHPENEQKLFIEKVNKVLEKGQLSSIVDLHHKRKDGKVIPIEINAAMIDLAGEKFNLSMVRDITIRKKAENRVIEWKNRYEAAIKASKHILYDWDSVTNEVKYGGSLEEILGYSIQDMGGGLEYWKSLIHPEDLQDFSKLKNSFIKNKSSACHEYRIRKKNGEYIYVEDIGNFVIDAQNSLIRMVGFMEDISERKRAETLLKKHSIEDGLTGLANRRRLDQVLEQEWFRAMREKKPLTVVMADIDHFKEYNDTYGHQRGDKCLKFISDCLKKIFKRPGDMVARYGGEEFVAILPDTERDGSIRVAESARKLILKMNMPHLGSKERGRVTISMGIATIVPNMDKSPSYLLELADKALYKAKNEGRNRVKAWDKSCQDSIDISQHIGMGI